MQGSSHGVNGLSNGGIGLATSGGFIAEIQSEIDQYSQQIVDGTITVPTTIE